MPPPVGRRRSYQGYRRAAARGISLPEGWWWRRASWSMSMRPTPGANIRATGRDRGP